MLHFLMLIAAGIIVYNVWLDNTATDREKKEHEKRKAKRTAKFQDERTAYWDKINSGDPAAIKAHQDKIIAENKNLPEVYED